MAYKGYSLTVVQGRGTRGKVVISKAGREVKTFIYFDKADQYEAQKKAQKWVDDRWAKTNK